MTILTSSREGNSKTQTNKTMINEIIKNIIGINQADVEAALKDNRPAHEAGVTHVIDVLATEAGYASGKAMINDLNIWSSTVAEITQMLIDDLEDQND